MSKIELTTATTEQKDGIREALVAQKSIADSTAEQKAELRALMNVTLSSFPALDAKLARQRNGAEALAKILVLGDSISGTSINPSVPALWINYGNGGILGGASQQGNTVSVSGGVTAIIPNDADYSSWITSSFWEVPTGESVKWVNNHIIASIESYPLPNMYRAEVCYRKQPGAGTFKIQDSYNGSDWNDLATINADAADGAGIALANSTDAANRYVRALVISGTVKIISGGWRADANGFVQSANGVHIDYTLSIGGTALADYLSAPSALWSDYLTAAAPDLVIVEFWDDYDTQWYANLRTLQAKLYSAAPNADVVYVIVHPVGPSYDFTEAERIAHRQAMIAFVSDTSAPGNKYLWDSAQVWGSYARGNALGLYLDEIHVNSYGERAIASQFARDFSLFSIPARMRQENFTDQSNTITGYNAASTLVGSRNVVSGFDAGGNAGDDNVLIGWRTRYDGSGIRNTIIGAQALYAGATGVSRSVLLGYHAGNSLPDGTNNAFVAGGSGAEITDVYFGEGYKSTLPPGYTIHGTSGSGSNVAGGDVTIAGGQGTGTGITGKVSVAVSPAGSTGSTLNGLVNAAQFDASTTAGHTRLLIYDVDNGTLERVTVGAADSGGSGFKVLRIPN